jgi:hypothetical protein
MLKMLGEDHVCQCSCDIQRPQDKQSLEWTIQLNYSHIYISFC